MGFWFRSWFWYWCWGLEYGLCLFGNRHGVLTSSKDNCAQQLRISLSSQINLQQIPVSMLSLLVGYWSGFVILLVWVCSMSADCNASHTTGKQTQCQHYEKLSLKTQPWQCKGHFNKPLELGLYAGCRACFASYQQRTNPTQAAWQNCGQNQQKNKTRK